MRKFLAILLITMSFISCCPSVSNGQEGESLLGVALIGEHKLLSVDDGYLRFDDGDIYFTWESNDGRYINSNMPFNQVVYRDTNVEIPFIKFRWSSDNNKYLHTSFNDGDVIYVDVYFDINNINDIYTKNNIILKNEEPEAIDETESNYQYTNDYTY